MAKYTSKLAQEIEQYADLLKHGVLLAIDPSSGSAGSLPGYALFKQGVLQDCGLISLPRGTRAISNRLYLLRESLLTEFKKPDILAVEYIAPVFPTKNGGFLHKSASSLTKSVGAIMSTWDVPVIEPAPTTWHALVREAMVKRGEDPTKYPKSDVNDAIAIAMAAFITLARALGEPDPIWPPFVREGEA